MELLVHVCHKHGALATGGMAALLLSSDEGFVSFDFLSYYSFLCVFFFLSHGHATNVQYVPTINFEFLVYILYYCAHKF